MRPCIYSTKEVLKRKTMDVQNANGEERENSPESVYIILHSRTVLLPFLYYMK